MGSIFATRKSSTLDVGRGTGLLKQNAGVLAVYATDYLVGDPRAELSARRLKELPTFRLAHSILNSKVIYHPDVSVYNIDRLGVADFDVILFCGVYYHLKNPLLALAKLRQVIKDEGIIIVEGAIVDGPQEAYARFYYRELLGDDPSNWWVPTISCLRQWIECSFFEPVSEHGPAYPWSRPVTLFRSQEPSTDLISSDRSTARGVQDRVETIARHAITAKAVRRKDPSTFSPTRKWPITGLNHRLGLSGLEKNPRFCVS